MDTPTTDKNIEKQYYGLLLELKKEFLMAVHKHPFITPIKDIDDDFYNQGWENFPDVMEHYYDGGHYDEFTSIDAVNSFSEAFDKLLSDNGINKEKHKGNLIYFMTLWNIDLEEQEVKNNIHNNLLDNARFLIELAYDGEKYFDQLSKDPRYKHHIESRSGQSVFILKDHKAGLVNTGADDEDIICFQEVYYYKTKVKLYPKANFNYKRNAKSGQADQDIEIAVPVTLNPSIREFIINGILKDQEYYNTVFYREFSNNDQKKDLLRLKQEYERRLHKEHLSNRNMLSKIAFLIHSYFRNQHDGLKIKYKNQTRMSKFLFEYFSLFKVFNIKSDITLPSDYSILSKFYFKQGFSFEWVRGVLKEAPKIGEIKFFDAAPLKEKN